MKKLLTGTLCLALAALCACGGGSSFSSKIPSDSDAAPAPAAASAPEKPEAARDEPASLPSPSPAADEEGEAEALPPSLTGEWTVYSESAGRDFGRLTLAPDGTCAYTRLSDGAAAAGTFSLERMYAAAGEEPDFFRLTLSELPAAFTSAGGGALPDGPWEMGGVCYRAGFAGEDWLCLREIGNGGSLLSAFVLTDAPGMSPGRAGPEWVLHRESGAASAEPAANAAFDAWIWKQEDGALWLQPMDAHTREDYTEFTHRHFLAAYFTPSDPGAARYVLSGAADTRSLLSEYRLGQRYPLLMVHAVTDAAGRIEALTELDAVEYGAYDLGDLEPAFDAAGMDFLYNGVRWDLTQYGASNAVLGCVRAGDWIVVEGHINPNVSEYLLFSIGAGDFVASLYGTNLIWRDDDLTTAVYLRDREVRSFPGGLVGCVSEGAPLSLEFSPSGGSVLAGGITEAEQPFTAELPLPPDRDRAMFAYGDYLLRPCAGKWRAFAQAAPESALGLVMTNPPDYILSRANYNSLIEPGSSESVLFAALRDGTAVRIDAGAPAGSGGWSTARHGRESLLEKGKSLRFAMTVPEGIPACALFAETDSLSAVWPVGSLSGEAPQYSAFVEDPAALAPYAPVLDETYDLLRNGYDEARDYRYLSTGVLELAMWMDARERLDRLGYAVRDISGDGVPELLIGGIPAEDGTDDWEQGLVYSGYTRRDGELLCFLEGWGRSRYRWMGGSRFYHDGSSGAMYSAFGTYHTLPDATELVCEDFYFTSDLNGSYRDMGLFHNRTGSWDKDESEPLEMSEAEFWALAEACEGECRLLPLTPFSAYKAS